MDIRKYEGIDLCTSQLKVVVPGVILEKCTRNQTKGEKTLYLYPYDNLVEQVQLSGLTEEELYNLLDILREKMGRYTKLKYRDEKIKIDFINKNYYPHCR